MTQQFADISGYQVPNPPLDGIDGVFVKSTEGTSYINPNFVAQASYVQSLNKELGFYHFADGLDPVAEAEYFVANTNRVDGEAQALDVEANFYNVVTDPVGWCLIWLQKVEELTGNKPGIYLSFSELQAYDWSRVVANGTWLWIAEWNGQNNPTITQFPVWTLWQYADTNVSGGDSDIFNGDIDTFRAIAKNTANPTQQGSPVPVSPSTPNEGNIVTEIPAQQLDQIHQFDNQVIDTVVAEVRANTKVVEDMVTNVGATLKSIDGHLATPSAAPTVTIDTDAIAAAVVAKLNLDPATLANLIAGHLTNTNIDALAAAVVKQLGTKLSA